MTQHLGLASEQGRLERIITRAGMINRLYDEELQEFLDQAMAKWRRRSAMGWTLGLTGVSDRVLRLKANVVRIGKDLLEAPREGEIIRTRIAGMRIEPDPDGQRLRLVAP